LLVKEILLKRDAVSTLLDLAVRGGRDAADVERIVNEAILVVIFIVATDRELIWVRLITVLRFGTAWVIWVVDSAVSIVVFTVSARRERDLGDRELYRATGARHAIDKDEVLARGDVVDSQAVPEALERLIFALARDLKVGV